MPDPATLDDQVEDSVPLSTVQKQLNDGEKPPAPKPKPAEKSAGLIPDLLGGDSQPARAPAVNEQINTNAVNNRPPSSATTNKQPPPAKIQTSKPATDSLLGLDFSSPPGSGSPTSATSHSPVSNQPSAATSSHRSSRPDLKKSILSLYSNPRPQQQQQQQQFVQPQAQQPSFQQPFALPQQQQPVAGGGGVNMFDSLTSATNNMSLESNNATSPPANTAKPSSGGMFDDLLSSSSASAWASTAPSHGSAASPPTNNSQQTDDWTTFTSASTTTAHTPAKPLSGLEDEIFGNVWK